MTADEDNTYPASGAASTTSSTTAPAGPASKPGKKRTDKVSGLAILAAPPVSAASADALGVDLDSLRLDQSYPDAYGVKRQHTTIPIRKPRKDEFFRVHPDKIWRFPIRIIEFERTVYVVGPAVRDFFPELTRDVVLYLAVNRNGDVFLIPVQLPGLDGRRNTWADSLAENVAAAQTKWIRSTSNMTASAYDQWTAERLEIEPQWPDLTPEELFNRAFRGWILDSEDHPVVRKLRGLE